MRRAQLEHVLRAASQIADDPNVLVIGSQSVLGAIPEDRLPLAATASIEGRASASQLPYCRMAGVNGW